jgi:two-component system response regulator AtoC
MSNFANLGLDLPSQAGFVPGRCEAILRVNAIVDQIAGTEIAVLLVGESGTGKEAYARLIHGLSLHSGLPLKKLNCTTLEPEQLRAQIKTYLQAPVGKTDGGQGTLFLDGVDELDLTGQKVLLSLLPDGEGAELGEKPLRLISSVSQDFDTEIESGRFRRELYFRMNGVCLHLPPLRERKEDIPEFMERFLARHASELKRQAPELSNEDLERLMAHDWPGNIRELWNLARKMVALGDPKIALADLGTTGHAVTKAQKVNPTFSLKVAARAASRQAERQLILKTLERTHWNRKRAAQELQISYKSLLYKIKQTGVDGTKASEQ